MDCFRHAKPGTRQQGEERFVGVPAKGIAFTQLRCGLEDALDFVRGKDVRDGARPCFTAVDRGRYLVMWIFRANVPRKSNHLAKPARSLTERRCRSSPLDGGLLADVVLARRIGERGEALQQASFGPECESRGAAYSNVRLHRLSQHDFTSGQGCVICRKLTTSTLA